MKNKLIVALAVIICFIPTLVAIISYNSAKDAPVLAENALSIVIEDTLGKKFTLERKAEGDSADELIKYFQAIKQNSTPISSLPDSLSGAKYYTVTVSSAVNSEVYHGYFSADPSTNYVTLPSGAVYKLNPSVAEWFIQKEYAEALYSSAALPVLTISTGDALAPDSATWKYMNYSREYVDADISGVVSPVQEEYQVEGNLGLKFDVDPDYCMVLVKDAAGNVLYDDVLDNMSLFTVSKDQDVTVSVIAKWFEDPSRTFFGEMAYDFTSHVLPAAEFYLGMTSVGSGRFTAITALNVTKPEEIKVESTLPGFTQPKFTMVGENTAVALFSVDPDTQTGSYPLTFTYGGVIQNTLLQVTHPGVRPSTFDMPQADFEKCFADSAVAEFNSLLSSLTGASKGEKLFSGYFLEGINGYATLRRGFGRDVYLNGSDDIAYRTYGVQYGSAAGLDVVAANAGVVVYAGNLTHSGNTVVVDHGLGLLTWYTHMGEISAKVGDTVARGDKLAVTGRTGFTSEDGAHISMSVGGKFVCPYDTWADSTIAGKVIIAKIEE